MTSNESSNQPGAAEVLAEKIRSYDEIINEAAKVIKALATKNAELESLEKTLLRAQRSFVAINTRCESAQQELDELGEMHETLLRELSAKEEELLRFKSTERPLFEAFRRQQEISIKCESEFEAARRAADSAIEVLCQILAENSPPFPAR